MTEPIKSYYNITNTILHNITGRSLNDFIRSINKMNEYTHSGKDYAEFLSELLNNNELQIEKLNDYLFSELLFGQQRSTYIKKIFSIETNMQLEQEVISIVSGINPQIKTSYYNKIATNFFKDGVKSELVAFKIIKNIDNKIIKINLIFAESVEVNNPKRRQVENSYIPIEIDLENNYFIAKVYPKAMVRYENQKPDQLAIKYLNIVTDLFKIQFTPFNPESRQTLYLMSKELLNQIYNKMIKSKPKDFEQNITLISEQITNYINIKNIDKKVKFNKFFDLSQSVTTLIENILIYDTLYNTLHEHDYTGINGFIVYLKFNDGKNVNARLKGENCDDTIVTSETFLALRSPIDNAKSISILQIRWIVNGKQLRVKYDATSSQFLHIHFYRDLSKDDFYYGIKKFEEFESKNITNIQGLDSVPSSNMA